jgi:hypothetical protein
MLKIQNANRIIGMTANGCRVVSVEYSDEKCGYFFNLTDNHGLNSEGSGYFQIRLLETDNVDRYSLFVMGWHICTVMVITKDDMKGPPDLASLMYKIIDKAIESKNSYK